MQYTIVPSCFFVFLVVFSGGCGQNRIASPDLAASQVQKENHAVPEASSSMILVYYFHPTMRCLTCRQIEFWSAQALETGFSEALAQGELIWQPLNLEDSQNQDLVKEFRIDGSTLIVAKLVTGKINRWKRLDQVWRLYSTPDLLMHYVQREVQDYLNRQHTYTEDKV